MKKEILLKTVLPFLMILGGIQLNAQSNFKVGGEIATPSTDAWNFIKYGEVSPNLYTGTLGLSIPFYTYKDNDFQIPISFDYSSNGFMPNMKPGILGPGWNLNVGGIITVDIKGIPDYGQDQYGNKGFYYLSTGNYSRDSTRFWRYIKEPEGSDGLSGYYSQVFDHGMPAPTIVYETGNDIFDATSKFDVEPDIYHFNFMGYSGTFHMGYNNKIYVYNTNVSNKEFKIEIGTDFQYITITTSDGYQYYFNTSSYSVANAEVSIDPNLWTYKMLAWKLSEITAPNGRKVTFNYERQFDRSCQPSGVTYIGNIADALNPNYPFDYIVSDDEFVINNSDKEMSLLKSISITNGPTIQFAYKGMIQNDDFHPTITIGGNSTTRLDSIIVKDLSNNIIKKSKFNYVTNTSSVKLNYLSSVSISGEGSYTLSYYNMNNTLPGIGTFSIDHWGYYNAYNNSNSVSLPFIKICSLDANFDETINSASRNSDAYYAKTGMLEKIQYPTGGYVSFEYEGNDYSKAMKRIATYNFSHKYLSETGTCGGVRVKKISYLNSNNDTLDAKVFEYKDGSVSSGILLHFPRYNIRYNASAGPFSEMNMNYYASNIAMYNGTHIEYYKVTEKRRDNSKIVYTFSASDNPYFRDTLSIQCILPDRLPLVQVAWENNIAMLPSIVVPVVSKQSERGKLLKKEIFKTLSDQAPAYSEINTYNNLTKNLTQFLDHVPVYLVRQFGQVPVFVDNYNLSQTKTDEYLNNVHIEKNTKLSYNSKCQVIRSATIDSKGDSLITKYKYVTDLLPAQILSNSVEEAMLYYNLISYPLTEEVYKKTGSGPESQISGVRYTYMKINSNYPSLIKLSKIEKYDNTNSSWFTDIDFTQFDNKGNILESKDKNGIYTSYVWGYNGLYLVAKVDNLDLNTLKSSLSGLSNISSTPLTGAMISGAQTTLKNSRPNAQITTYEYVPFIGLSKIIDPSGKITEFQYNASGKLKNQKDGIGTLHKEYFYSPDNKL